MWKIIPWYEDFIFFYFNFSIICDYLIINNKIKSEKYKNAVQLIHLK